MQFIVLPRTLIADTEEKLKELLDKAVEGSKKKGLTIDSERQNVVNCTNY